MDNSTVVIANSRCGLCISNDLTKPLYKVAPISVGFKNLLTPDSTKDNVMNCPGCIYSGFSWHVVSLPGNDLKVNDLFLNLIDDIS